MFRMYAFEAARERKDWGTYTSIYIDPYCLLKHVGTSDDPSNRINTGSGKVFEYSTEGKPNIPEGMTALYDAVKGDQPTDEDAVEEIDAETLESRARDFQLGRVQIAIFNLISKKRGKLVPYENLAVQS